MAKGRPGQATGGLGNSERNLRRKRVESRKTEEVYAGCLKINALFKCQEVLFNPIRENTNRY